MWNLIIPAVASLVGGALSSSGAKSAAKAQQQAADQNIALQKGIYDDQRALAAPGYLTGGAATNALARIHGLPTQDYGASLSGGQSDGAQWDAYMAANPDVMAAWTDLSRQPGNTIKSSAEFAKLHYNQHGQAEGRTLPSGAATPATGANALANPMADFEASPYAKIATSGFRGVDVPEIKSAYARGGKVLSGAQSIALDERGKNRLGGAFTEYTNGLRSLAGQAQTGASAISGAAGTFGANASNENTAAGQARANALASGYKGMAQGISGAVGAVTKYGQDNWGWST